MHPKSRDARRHERQRLMDKRRKYWGRDRPYAHLDPLTKRQLSRVARTPRPSSYRTCSSPGPSWAETRSNIRCSLMLMEMKEIDV